MELNDILSEKEPEAAPAEAPVVEAPEAPQIETEAEAQARGRDESGRFVPKETPKEAPAVEPPAPPAQPQMTDKERGLLAAAMEERNKRQAAERRLAEYEAAKAAVPAEPPKTFFDDPDGYAVRIERDRDKFREEMAQTVTNTRLNTAETIARSKYADFDDKIAVFAEALKANPALHQQWLQSPDPAEYAYRTGKAQQDLQAAGSIENLRAQIEKETRDKLEVEYREKAAKAIKDRAAIPGSLSDVRGTVHHAPVWGGPPSLDEVLKG